MQCPRCNAQMTPYEAPLVDGSGVIEADRCTIPGRECGVWYDAHEYAALHARLNDRSVRAALLAARRVGAEPGRENPTCPRCAASGAPRRLAQVAFVGLTLDLCETCLGLWIDRDEVPALLNALDLYEPGESEMRVTHYRSAVTGAGMRPNAVVRTRCVRCRQLVALERSLATERGLMCVLCAEAYERGEAPPSWPGVDPGEVRSGRSALWSYVRSALAHLGIR